MSLGQLLLQSWLLAIPGQAEGERGHFVAEGSRAPSLDLAQTSGARWSSRDHGGKPCVIAFVRSGQASSRSVITDLERLRKQLAAKPWTAILVVSGREAGEEARSLTAEGGFGGTVLIDPDRSAYARFGVVAVPSVAVVDGEGRVIHARAGLGKDSALRLEEALRGALQLPAGARTAATPSAEEEAIRAADSLAERGKLEEARTLLEAAARKTPGPEILLELGRLHLLEKNADRALATFQELERRFPQERRAVLGAGRALTSLGRLEEARKTLERALLGLPLSWEVHEAMGELHELSGQAETAAREYRRALELLKKQLGEERSKRP